MHRRDEIVAFADALLDLDARAAGARALRARPPGGRRPLRVAGDVAEALPARDAPGCRSPSAAAGTTSPGARRPTGLLIDTAPARLDRGRRRNGHRRRGRRLGEIYDALAPHGRTVAAGCGPTVGIAGLALGGGIGLLGRTHGFTCDQVRRRRDRPARRHDPARRRRAPVGLKGAGGARFGVVTQLMLKTVPAPDGDRAAPRAPRRARSARDLAAPRTPPDALAASLLIIGGTAHVFGAHIGPPDEAAALLAPFGGTPRLEELPYREVKRRLAETGPGDGEDLPFHRSGFFPHAVAIDDSTRRSSTTSRRSAAPTTASPPDATAFPHRDARFLLKVAGRDLRGRPRLPARQHRRLRQLPRARPRLLGRRLPRRQPRPAARAARGLRPAPPCSVSGDERRRTEGGGVGSATRPARCPRDTDSYGRGH